MNGLNPTQIKVIEDLIGQKIKNGERKKAKTYEVKDTDGEKFQIKAHEYTVSGNGLQFYINNIRCAWFTRWANFKVIKTPKADYSS